MHVSRIPLLTSHFMLHFKPQIIDLNRRFQQPPSIHKQLLIETSAPLTSVSVTVSDYLKVMLRNPEKTSCNTTSDDDKDEERRPRTEEDGYEEPLPLCLLVLFKDRSVNKVTQIPSITLLLHNKAVCDSSLRHSSHIRFITTRTALLLFSACQRYNRLS